MIFISSFYVHSITNTATTLNHSACTHKIFRSSHGTIYITLSSTSTFWQYIMSYTVHYIIFLKFTWNVTFSLPDVQNKSVNGVH
ncbi:hypothetical protein GDO81_003693 [Engystomops pustulosus]|uniref:Uncharacterized protein n=1 Tax=Engystomops pustulosus TaxID=76066 RepID=A0AAV6ZYH8_ENGPU|nr:hypothetical protein GDO81_003693 [Engystomops pustulosus]